MNIQTKAAFKYKIFSLILLFFGPIQSKADLLPAQNATLTLIDSSVYLVVSTPASALTGIDDNGDGLISNSELNKHDTQIQQQFQERFRLTDDGKPGTPVLTMVKDPGINTTSAGFPYIVVLQRINFSSPPKSLLLTTDLFGTNKGEDKLTLQATLGKASDPESRTAVVILEPANNSQRLFVGGWETFTKFIRIGVEHILSGKDHLLFLLTILVAAAGWRYWLSVVTSFTIAHSITLSLSALGTIRVEASLVEQAIAASIVLMALHNLLRQGTHTRGLVPMVFGCGLLHGLGFASALSEMGLDSGHRVATLAGFNVGVECGQFIFLIGVISIITLIRRFIPAFTERLLTQLASTVAVILGGKMLIERIEFLNQLLEKIL